MGVVICIGIDRWGHVWKSESKRWEDLLEVSNKGKENGSTELFLKVSDVSISVKQDTE